MNALDHTAFVFRNPTLAERILAGDLPKADWPLYTDAQWRSEAQAALDTGDYSDLQWMIDHEVAQSAERVAEYRREQRGYRRSWLAPVSSYRRGFTV